MGELRSGLLFLALALLTIRGSLQLGLGTLKEPGPGFLSFCAGVILSLLCLSLIYRSWRIRKPLKPHSRNVILVLVSLFVYTLVLDAIGFVVATFFFVGVLFQLGEPRRFLTLLGMSTLTTLLLYLVFSTLLNIRLPKGFLGI